ncbi:MAG TPA: CDC27 family protein [Balneolales bacterium]|nr:CDC27 family protein [Balneolales bacterium]
MPDSKQSKYIRSRIFLFGLALILGASTSGFAQNNSNSRFLLANQLMQQGEYQQAYSILSRLYQQNPQSYPVYDKTVECLVQLKRYDQAIDITKERLGNHFQDVIAGVRLGELYQLKGDTTKSNDIWQRVLEANKKNSQVYRYLAQTEQKYHNYDRAAEIYNLARKQLHNPNLFLFESANNFVMAANYEKASRLYVQILKSNPDQIGAVEQEVLKADDPQLYDSLILDLKDLGNATAVRGHQMQIQEFLIWLYTERKSYKEALTTAERLETGLNGKGFPVYSLGRHLVSLDKFELANEAFKWYNHQQGNPLAGDALEQRARLYVRWARYLEQYHLALENRIDSLYHTSYLLFEELSQRYPAKTSKTDLLAFESELALNHIHSVTAAENNLGAMEQSVRNNHDRAQLDYIKGRIQLFKGDFSQARIFLTRSNKLAGNGELASKTRYYLSLADFYAGDFEFSKIQMHALERDYTSLYSNDALKIRMYIQDGMVGDSVTAPLRQFSHAMFLYDTGKNEIAVDSLLPHVVNYERFGLKDDMVLLIIKAWRDSHPQLAYLLVDQFLQDNPTGPLAERLYWERARLANVLYQDQKSIGKFNVENFSKSHQHLADSPEIIAYLTNNNEIRLQKASTKAGVVKAYEDLLMHYPKAFYATYARNKIHQLQAKAVTS